MLGPTGTVVDPVDATTHEVGHAGVGPSTSAGAESLPACPPDGDTSVLRTCMQRVAGAADQARVLAGPRAFHSTAKLRGFWQQLFGSAVPVVDQTELKQGSFGVTVPIPCCREADDTVRKFAFKFTRDRLGTEFPYTAEGGEVEDAGMHRYFLTQLTRPMPLRNEWIGIYTLGTKDLLDFLSDVSSQLEAI